MAGKRKAEAQGSSDVKRATKSKPTSDDEDDFISDDGQDPMLSAIDIADDGEDSGSSEGEADLIDDEAEESAMDDEEEEVEEEEGSMEDVEANTAQAYGQKKGSSLYKAPTNEEMQTLKSGSTLYKSNLFSMQLDLLLPSLRPLPVSMHPAPAALSALTSTLQSLRPFLLALPALATTTPQASLKQYPDLPYPNSGPAEDSNWKMTFVPPKEVQIVGDWALETVSSSKASKKGKGKEGAVDMALMMPEEYFQEKDFLNGRFFFKQIYWLGVIGKALSDQTEKLGLGAVEWSVTDGSDWKPVLVLKSKQDKSAKDFSKLNLVITLHPTIPTSLFPATKLSPSRNNLRPPPSSAAPPPPTPHYNAQILSSTLPAQHLVYLHHLSLALPAYKDASLMLQLWGRQRGFGAEIPWQGYGGWSGWCQMVMGLLVFGGNNEKGKKESGKRLGRGMSSYQVFRGVLDFFTKRSFFTQPVFLHTQPNAAPSAEKKIPTEDWMISGLFDAVFVDPTGSVNLLSGVERGVLEILGQEAKGTLELLDEDDYGEEKEEVFDSVFLRKATGGERRFDLVFRIDISSAKPLLQPALARLDQPSRTAHLMTSVSSVVRRALNTRAKCVVSQKAVPSTTTSRWTFGSPKPTPAPESQVIELGIILDQREAARLVDHGPSAEEPEASQEFRDFWGDKSELRRFKDGRILESVVWEVGPAPEERSLIVGRSVRYILNRHFGLDADEIPIESLAAYLPLLRLPASATNLLSTDASSEGFRPAIDAYNQLTKTLKAMEDLPLSLLNIFPVAEGLRYSSVFPPLPIDTDRFSLAPDCLKYIEPLDVVIQFESSGRWPDDLTAIQKIKLAFFEKIAKQFRDRLRGCIVSVAMDEIDDAEEAVIEDNCSLEIFVPSGYAFRLRIHHDRERFLLEQMIADKKSTNPHIRRVAQKALDIHHSRFTYLPRHHSAMAALHHLYPSFSTTVRLTKRWFASHMLSSHVSAQMIELICAHVYLKPPPYRTPASPSAGFARVVGLLSTWKWKSVPLFVPLYSAAGMEAGQKVVFPKEKGALITEKFKRFRATDPMISHGAFVVATEEDLSGRVFGASSPTRLVAGRITQLAKATILCLEPQDQVEPLNVLHVFKTPTSDYNFLIHLKPAVLPRLSQALEPNQAAWASKYKNLSTLQASSSTYGRELRLQFDPVQLFIRDLRTIYGETFVLFQDSLGGSVIGGIWNPTLQEPRNFKIQTGFSGRPVAREGGDKKSQMIRLNEAGVVAEIERLGEGLVERVQFEA